MEQLLRLKVSPVRARSLRFSLPVTVLLPGGLRLLVSPAYVPSAAVPGRELGGEKLQPKITAHQGAMRDASGRKQHDRSSLTLSLSCSSTDSDRSNRDSEVK